MLCGGADAVVRAHAVDDLSIVWAVGQDPISPMPAKPIKMSNSKQSMPASTFVPSSFRAELSRFSRSPDASKTSDKKEVRNRNRPSKLRESDYESLAHEVQAHDPVRSISFTDDEMFFLVGLQSGTIWAYSSDKWYIKHRLKVRIAGYGLS